MDTDARIIYGDIIDHEHHIDPDHPPMSRLNRAAQFSPFAALTGYEDLIDETARQTSEQIELDESNKEEIGRRIDILLHTDGAPQVEIMYFVQDEKKRGGSYETVKGKVKTYEALSHTIRLDTGATLIIDDIINVKADCFDDLENC